MGFDGVEGEGVAGDGVLVGEGEGEVSSGAPRAPPTPAGGVAKGSTKRMTQSALASTLSYNVYFAYPRLHFAFLWRLRVLLVLR